jgi:hypothetical protein
MGEAKRRKKLNPNYGKPIPKDEKAGIEEDYECYGERAEYFKNLNFYLDQGGAFEKGLPNHHKYRSVRESHLFQFIQNAIEHEEQAAIYILSKVKSLSDLTEIPSDLLGLVDKSIMSKRAGDLNQAFKYYDQVFSQNQTWFMLWYGLAKLLCLFREYKMAFACMKICTFLYPKMWNGRQYRSDHNLSYHYDQIYALAVIGEENESYLKSLGRPLNTFRVANSCGKVRKNSPVGKIQDISPERLSFEDSENPHPDSEDPHSADGTDKVMLIKHEAMTKRLTKPVYVYGSLVESIHMLVCKHPMHSNRGFCHIKTREHQITLWLDNPFQKRKKETEKNFEFSSREWYGTFTTEILNGKILTVNRAFSMRSLSDLGIEVQMQAMLTGEPVDRFVIEGLISTETSIDLPPEEITIQAPVKN